MLKQLFFLAILIIAFDACSKKVPNTDIDVAKAFIRDVMDNNFDAAQPLMLENNMNDGYLVETKRKFALMDQTELQNYKNADIIFNDIKKLNDSTTVINYATSYKPNTPMNVEAVRVSGQWMIDLKYTFNTNK